jgi:hypothetical protein
MFWGVAAQAYQQCIGSGQYTTKRPGFGRHLLVEVAAKPGPFFDAREGQLYFAPPLLHREITIHVEAKEDIALEEIAAGFANELLLNHTARVRDV